ncbi:MAG: YkvA family protein [Anaerolineales bacterium]
MDETTLPTATESSPVSRFAGLSRFPQRIRRDLELLRRAQADPRTPCYVRLLFGLLLAYALSPIDLIPDFIPLLGHLDDLLLLPLGLALCVRLLPQEMREE